MKFIVLCVLVASFLIGADINKELYSENNVSKEIQRIRTLISERKVSSEEEQNKISIQKLFLNKIEVLSTSVDKVIATSYTLSKDKELSQKEFLKYFDDVAKHLDAMHEHEQNEEVLHKHMASVKDQLRNLSPKQTDEVLQGQLQYAYLKWKEIFNTRTIKQYKSFLENEKNRFKQAFERVEIDLKALDKATEKQDVILQELYQNKVYLELRLEKETILVASKKKAHEDLNSTELLTELKDSKDNWKYNFVRNELQLNTEKISAAIRAKNSILLLRQIKNLQQEQLDEYILTREVMLALASDLSKQDRELFNIEMKMLEWLKYEHVGELTAIWYDFEAWANDIYGRSEKIINAPLFYNNDQAVRLYDFMKMFLTIILGFIIAKFYKRRVNSAQRRITFIQKQSFKIVGNIGYYIIVIVTIAISLSNIGLDLSSLSLVAGALSVGIGFGLKEVVGNFVSGIILMVERSVKIGDFVELDNGISGNIIDIRMRSVTIKTSSNIDIIVPNSSLVQHSFTNYTLEESVRRLSIPFTVAYGVSFEEVSQIILEALEKSDLNHIRNSKEYVSEVIMSGMDERGVNYTLFVFVNTYGPNARSSFFRLVYKTLSEHQLPIPSPRLEVNVKEGKNDSL